MNLHATNCFRHSVSSGLGAVVTTGLVNLFGRNWINIGYLHAAGFGIVAGASAYVSSKLLAKIHCEGYINTFASTVIAGMAAYATSGGLVALGYAVTPISIPSAIILTIACLGSWILAQNIHTYMHEEVQAAERTLQRADETFQNAKNNLERGTKNLEQKVKEFEDSVHLGHDKSDHPHFERHSIKEIAHDEAKKVVAECNKIHDEALTEYQNAKKCYHEVIKKIQNQF